MKGSFSCVEQKGGMHLIKPIVLSIYWNFSSHSSIQRMSTFACPLRIYIGAQ